MNATAFFRSHGLGLTIAATSLGFLLVQLDVSILNVALAQIGEAEGTGVTGLQWVFDAYAIAFASLLLTAGALGDRIGAHRTYIGGLALFSLASLGCGLPPGTGVLIAARAIQGIGAAFLLPRSLALLTPILIAMIPSCWRERLAWGQLQAAWPWPPGPCWAACWPIL